MKIEAGKRYVRRDGDITAKLKPTGFKGRELLDQKHGVSYLPDLGGELWGNDASSVGLVKEYRSPIPAILITAALCIAMLAGSIWFERTFPEVEYLEAGALTDNDRSEK